MKKENEKRKKQAKLLRTFRKVHRMTGAALFVFFFIVAITALLLGWKKNSYGIILSKTQTGTSIDLKKWLPLDSLHQKATSYLLDSVSDELSIAIERIDVRKNKGIVKFVFANYYGVQLDGVTGNLLLIERRRSDFIEGIHDGSVLDVYFKTNGNPIKLVYTTIMSLSLLTFTITGFWLWLGPKRMRKSAEKQVG